MGSDWPLMAIYRQLRRLPKQVGGSDRFLFADHPQSGETLLFTA